MSLTLHISGPLAGDGHVIEAQGKTKLADVKKQISSVISVSVGDFEMVHGGEVMGDMNMLVSQTALCEGDEVVIEPSRRFLAGQRLREMGVGVTVDDLHDKIFESNDVATSDEEKAAVVELMVEYDPGFVRAENAYGWTPLRCACHFNNEAAIMFLAQHSAIDSKNKDGESALHIAAYYGKLAIARLLIDEGADVNCKDNFGCTPLHDAARAGAVEVAKLLLGKGADICSKDWFGESPLDKADGQTELVKLLLKPLPSSSL
eukprot:TRINITY_DN688_c0_g1_i11.p1 TRINITY_DN688_c0_g1~~TRINITY_DN688_c0_g1_i11.p1  ORF type:complete len:261 (+),score=74.44 TRINITY_DN688_c0_g1_i11:749-1531(+)